MRKTHKVLRDVFLLSILVLLSFKAHAQFNVNATGVTLRQILDTSIRYAELSGDTTEGGKIRTARSIEAFWSSRVSKNDSSHINMFGLYYKTLNQAVLAKYAGTCTGSGQFQGAWRCIGPDKLDKQAMGYVECVWADPDDDFTTTTGPRRLLAGTYGGLFKSTDGGGQWKCITDNAPIANGINLVSSIAVRPGDKSVIYLGMGGVSGGGHYWESFQGYGVTGLYGASILKTSDGGQNWQQEKVGTANSPGDEFDRVQKVFFTPSGNYLIAFKNERIFIRAYNSTTWDEITTSNNNPLATFGNAAQWRDLEFVPGDPNADNHFYIASAHSLNAPTAGGAFEVTKSGGLWTIAPIINMGSPNNSLGLDYTYRVELSIPDANYLYAAFMYPLQPGGSGPAIARYNLNTSQWSLVSYSNIDISVLKGEFVVSSQKVQCTAGGAPNYNIYAGGDNPWQSCDGGLTFIKIGNYWGPNTHADVRGIALQKSTPSLRGKDDVVFFATDGGVAIKPANKDPQTHQNWTCEDVSGEGLTCTTYWGFSTSEAGGLITAGGQHTGMHAYEPKHPIKWYCESYGDGAATYFDQDNKEKSWGTEWTTGYTVTAPSWGRKLGTWNSGGSFPSDPKILNFSLPLFADKGNNHFVGQQHLYRKKSGNTSWDRLSDQVFFPNAFLSLPAFNQSGAETFIRAYAFSPYETSNPIGYVVYQPNSNATGSANLWRRVPGVGAFPDFDDVSSPTNGNRPITDVTL